MFGETVFKKSKKINSKFNFGQEREILKIGKMGKKEVKIKKRKGLTL